MRSNRAKILISLSLAIMVSTPVFAESLFRTGIAQNIYSIQPRPLFSTVRAKGIGDLVTILIEQETSTSDDVSLNVKKSSSTTDKFSDVINDIFKTNNVPSVNNFGGASETKNQTKLARKSSIQDVITAQVVQILPNGNLVVQGKKVALNSGEKVDIVISGIIDPRLLDNQGRISSNLVANLQIGVVGKGTVSRSDSEGTFSKILRYLF